MFYTERRPQCVVLEAMLRRDSAIQAKSCTGNPSKPYVLALTPILLPGIRSIQVAILMEYSPRGGVAGWKWSRTFKVHSIVRILLKVTLRRV